MKNRSHKIHYPDLYLFQLIEPNVQEGSQCDKHKTNVEIEGDYLLF